MIGNIPMYKSNVGGILYSIASRFSLGFNAKEKRQSVFLRQLWRGVTVVSFMGLAASVGVINSASKAEAGLCQGISIPSYFFPGALWNQAIASAPRVSLMIMNPNSGPGASKNSAYVTAVRNAQASGIRVIGYVSTRYGQRSAATVKREIDTYKNWYSVDGIFVDEVSSSTTSINYYKDIANYIRAKNGTLVMLNPGTVPAEAYVRLADIVVVFEGTYSSYQSWQVPSWLFNYPSSKFSHLVYATSNSTLMTNAIRLAVERNAGNVYVTNDVLLNPWDTLPTYWNEELNAIEAKCSAQ